VPASGPSLDFISNASRRSRLADYGEGLTLAHQHRAVICRLHLIQINYSGSDYHFSGEQLFFLLVAIAHDTIAIAQRY
jgi:hypothetical protein